MPYIGKKNYYKVSLEELKELPADKKPTLLLHACCGPCSCFPLTFLCPYFDVTIYYGNSNIYPEEEFLRRRNELEKLLLDLKKDYGFDVKLIEPTYDHQTYMADLREFANLKEGGERCFRCYRKRIGEAYDYAESHGFDYCCTVMTISRQKNSQILNKIGQELEANHPHCKYFYSDFKKNNGIEIGRAMRIHYDLYNQDYCGCEYSYAQRMKEKAERENPKIDPEKN